MIKLTKKKILVIGGTGFIGRQLIKTCLKIKMDVTSLSKNKIYAKKKILNKVKYLFADISKLNSLKSVLKEKYDFIVNLGGNVDHKNKKLTLNSHYLGVRNLYEVFKKDKKIKNFIQIGSSSEYGKIEGSIKENIKCKPKLIYGWSKLKATNFLIKKFEKNGFPVTILRFFQVYGPLQKKNRLIPYTIDCSLKNKRFYCSEGSQFRDFLYISDAVRAIINSLNNEKALGQIINIGYGKPFKVKDIINKICNITNKGNPIFGKINLRSDESKKIFPITKKAEKILNWKKKITLNKGISNTIKFYKEDSQK